MWVLSVCGACSLCGCGCVCLWLLTLCALVCGCVWLRVCSWCVCYAIACILCGVGEDFAKRATERQQHEYQVAAEQVQVSTADVQSRMTVQQSRGGERRQSIEEQSEWRAQQSKAGESSRVVSESR